MTARDPLSATVWAQVAGTMLGEACASDGIRVPGDELHRWAGALGTIAVAVSRYVSRTEDVPSQRNPADH
ncbi:hypothetical protein [Gandjariella thermophila]|uniref:Uncharacterized protein n=1 Tax=Gandjariella thermophila TaxID=1931992 RepID=A0A4D4JAC4_9PSEU|nr:hypothetical protein [Gandjariella thermophila]GDY32272.1 hypothetical protein GTS_39050 [Gandjariella thermophila]